MSSLIIHSTRFVKSSPDLAGHPDIDLPEVVILGRSNVGKSSLINYLTGQKNLAKSSKVPGKTNLINFFNVDDSWFLVDFPGYGYAKKGHETRITWMDAMQEYLLENHAICGVLLLLNGHLPPQKVDMMMMQNLEEEKIPFSVVYTKIDKVNAKVLKKNMQAFKQFFDKHTIQPIKEFFCSSEKKQGREKILTYVHQLLNE